VDTSTRRNLLTLTLEIVLRVWNDLEIFGSLTGPTLALIDSNGGMDKNIIYAILHEAIYCQG
jgi:proline iminopeptidase